MNRPRGAAVALAHIALAMAALWPAAPARAEDEAMRPYSVVGDGIPVPLTAEPGNPARGREIVISRQLGLCLLCHSGPFPDPSQQGTLAPTLAGAGERWSEAQLRLRLVDSRRVNPLSVMPAYFRADGLVRVGRVWKAKPVLTARQIEDTVAFLRTLKAP